MLNGLEKTLERKLPDRERRWRVEEESMTYGANRQSFPEGYPVVEE